MVWRVKAKEDPKIEEIKQEVNLDEEPLDLSEEDELKERLKAIEEEKRKIPTIKKIQVPSSPKIEFNKQEIADAINGTLNRLNQLIELYRRM